jgi:hypothetical protein
MERLGEKREYVAAGTKPILSGIVRLASLTGAKLGLTTAKTSIEHGSTSFPVRLGNAEVPS